MFICSDPFSMFYLLSIYQVILSTKLSSRFKVPMLYFSSCIEWTIAWLYTANSSTSKEFMKVLHSCRTGRVLAYSINISCHLQLLLVLTDLHLFKTLSGSDCSQPSPVSGTMLPPLVRQRYCNAVPVSTASVSVGLCSFVTQYVLVTKRGLTTHLTLLHWI